MTHMRFELVACESWLQSRHPAWWQRLAAPEHPGNISHANDQGKVSMVTDFGRIAGDYARHRAEFPEVFFERLFADGSVHKGDVVLDLGTGTGSVARGLAEIGRAHV